MAETTVLNHGFENGRPKKKCSNAIANESPTFSWVKFMGMFLFLRDKKAYHKRTDEISYCSINYGFRRLYSPHTQKKNQPEVKLFKKWGRKQHEE